MPRRLMEGDGPRTLQGYGGDEMGAGPRIHREGAQYIYIDEKPTKARRQYVPLGRQSVGANSVVSFEVTPQEIFQVQKINIASSNSAGDLTVNDITVGKKSQILNNGEMDVLCFAPDAVSSYVDFDAGKVGNTFTVDIENHTATAVNLAPMAIALVAE